MQFRLDTFSSLATTTHKPLLVMKTALSTLVLVILSSLGSLSSASGLSSLDNNELLSRLDAVVANRQHHYDIKKSRIDSLARVINNSENNTDKLGAILECGELWRGLSADSAITTLNKGLNLSRAMGDTCYNQLFRTQLAYASFLSGHVMDYARMLTDLKNEGLCENVKPYFYYTAMVVSFTIDGFYAQEDIANDNQGDEFGRRGREYARQVQALYGEGTPRYFFAKALEQASDGNSPGMISSLKTVLDLTDEDDSQWEVANTLLGEYYMRAGNNNDAIRHYALGAMGDIKLCNLNEVALLRLGELLYKLGDNSRAYNYLTISLENAVKADMKFNLMRLNKAFTDVFEIQQSEKQHNMMFLFGLVVILVMLLVVVAFMTVDKRREVKHLRVVESRLAEANRVREALISQLMSLCSSYIESLEDYNRMSRRKITAGQTDELLSYIKSGKVIDEQRAKFNEVFDKAILQIYPTYIDDVNKLLQPDKQIVTPSPEVLTTELRILALSRLGIEDSAIVARFLGITNNTIYTYRNKLRTRSANRATFEEDARKIGAI